jgi:hypothetical protein
MQLKDKKKMKECNCTDPVIGTSDLFISVSGSVFMFIIMFMQFENEHEHTHEQEPEN